MSAPTVKIDDVNTLFLDNYLGLIKGLTREQKIQLAARLTHDIAETTNEHINDMDLVDKFCGAWKSEKDADEIITEIRTARNFN
jgi:phenylpyruvate tautomerase PptA (4-oxalocrotonate tautomerase family)